ncbi:DNA polymerase 1 [uncultured archaeon]|nr:DNA polymerase 1 [uncultured archaeon]
MLSKASKIMYISARTNRHQEKIEVVSRVNGKRIEDSFPIDYTFYYSDSNGGYRTIFGDHVSKVTPKSSKEFHIDLSRLSGKKLWESDLNPVFKCLSKHFRGSGVPNLHLTFLDIEVNFSKEKGYATPEDPFSEVTAITISYSWEDNRLITLALRPKTYSAEKAQEIGANFSDTIVFETEKELLDAFLLLIEDSDVLSGWNSESYDIPYLVNRIIRVLGKDDTRRLCLWNEYPQEKKIEKYGKESKTYELVGRVAIDLLQVYRKFTYEERHSYSLDSIAEYELHDCKTPYAGSLDQLYYDDFEKFIEYNRKDVELLVRLEDKLKFISLMNMISHENSVLIPNALGTVTMMDQAILNRVHDMGLIGVNRRQKDAIEIPGAYVANPNVGVHEWVGSFDLTSLYPSNIRALNMSPETIVAQVRLEYTEKMIREKLAKEKTWTECWTGVFETLEYQAIIDKREDVQLIIDWEKKSSETMTAADVYKMIFESGEKWVISANATIYSLEHVGVVPEMLTDWFRDRKNIQRQAEELDIILHGVKIPMDVYRELDA